MDTGEILKRVTSDASISMRVASQRMERSPNFLAALRHDEREPQVNTMAEIADVYGYDLLLRKRDTGEELFFSPPKRG